ncbi:aspartate aminotransferase family protein [Staphylococcus muscae]|uniref:4-aminobutyrate aminotransferase n=1 Tax=Staphylococcus muscae TaxID=1294 RepID=A0A240BXQ2_9STAP|nr:aspartate aminotransferase family protein [Staphylococcus muscae]AVQ34360.1 aspartate aminotransferase family protein [Staphylococcus muscae]PNZ03173.1 aspartate aminotransferase family protein [Staphylococcus muscae]GGA83860.1 aspartate aminotransferase family protein [Staphylococcus muscae]SNW00440.1 4-aminobutyrate aminotransferase [Staphylococcus muscae]
MITGDKVKKVIECDKKYFAKAGRIPYYPLVIESAHGATLTDVNGKQYIDLLSSASSQNVGHTPKKVVEAIQRQAEKMVHYTPAYMHHEPLSKLAERLCRLSPGDFDKKVLFGLTGSDAVDGMIKFARGYTGRPYVISFTNAYHGSTYGSITASAISLNMRRKIGPLLPGFFHIPYPDAYRGMYGAVTPSTVEEYLAPLKEMFETFVPPEEVACILIETFQGDGGLLEPIQGYFEALADICRAHGILLAIDDIQQGFGRTGKFSSVEHFDIEADLIAYGKSIAGGMPMSAIVGRSEVMDGLDAPAHLFTTGANPVCCEAAIATLDILEDENLIDETARKGQLVKHRMQQWLSKYQCVGDVRGEGLSIGIDIVSDKINKTKDAEAALKICNACFEQGVVIIAIAGSVLRFQPPLVITDEALDQALTVIESVIDALEKGALDNYQVEGQGW